MAQETDDGKFWLPTEFLNDEDMLMDFVPGKPNSGVPSGDFFPKGSSGLYSLYGFGSYGPNSDLSSPVESVMGSTETESDEEEYLNELSRKLAQSTLEDNFWKTETNFGLENRYSKSTRAMAGSPQSTLCGCKQISSRGSPNCPSPQVTAAPLNRRIEPAWDLLSVAAGEVARMRMAEEAASRYYNPNRNYIRPQPPRKSPSPNLQFHQLQVAQFQQLKQQQMMKQQQQQQYLHILQQNRARNGGGNVKPVALPLFAWPTLHQSQPQQPPGSGMRAVFLGNPNTKRECTGTGVFLPRQTGAPTEPRKKRGCSTVLLPDRVVHALNLNLEAPNKSNGRSLPSDYDAEMSYRSSVLMADQRRQQMAVAEKDLRLPQEWTY